MDCVQRQRQCEVLVALDLDRRDSEEWTALMFSVHRGVGEMVIGEAVAGVSEL